MKNLEQFKEDFFLLGVDDQLLIYNAYCDHYNDGVGKIHLFDKAFFDNVYKNDAYKAALDARYGDIGSFNDQFITIDESQKLRSMNNESLLKHIELFVDSFYEVSNECAEWINASMLSDDAQKTFVKCKCPNIDMYDLTVAINELEYDRTSKKVTQNLIGFSFKEDINWEEFAEFLNKQEEKTMVQKTEMKNFPGQYIYINLEISTTCTLTVTVSDDRDNIGYCSVYEIDGISFAGTVFDALCSFLEDIENDQFYSKK